MARPFFTIAACLLIAATVSGATKSAAKSRPSTKKKSSGGLAGVPWTASRGAFRQALPNLTCSLSACRGSFTYMDIRGQLQVTWGGLSPLVSSSTFGFATSDLLAMKAALTRTFGAPNRQYRERGETVAEWKLTDTVLRLYHGTSADSPQVYFEPIQPPRQ